ncbi:MAG: hypothetical protein ABI273_22385 [Lacunisphaera sp.]
MGSTNFRFSALAALAGRAPIGGQREVALATYVVARLAEDVALDRGLTEAVRSERAGHAKQWLSTLALPARMRQAFSDSADASARDCSGAALAIRGVITATVGLLDPAARHELDRLVEMLEGLAPQLGVT